MPAVPKPAEPCALRARSWTLSPVSPHPPGVGSGQPPEAQTTARRLQRVASGPIGGGGLGCRVRDLWLLASTRCWGKPPPGSPLGVDPRLWSQPLPRRVRVGWEALHSHVLAVFFFSPSAHRKRGVPSVTLHFEPRGAHSSVSGSR